MAWKYVNPGYGELFDNNAWNTVTSSDISKTITGVYFTKNGDNTGWQIKAPSVKEVWAKCNVYLNGTWQKFRLYVDETRQCGLVMQEGTGDTAGYMSLYNAGAEVVNNDQQISLYRHLINVTLHIKSDSTNGLMELFIDDVPVLTYSGNVNYGKSISRIEVSGATDVFISNIIIADYDVSHENTAVCSLTDLTGTWDGVEDGMTRATDVNQILSQKVNIIDLKEKMNNHSSNPTITGITIAAQSVRFDANKVNALKGTIKSGSTEEYTNTQVIKSNNYCYFSTYIKNISLDTLSTMTLNLTSVKQ